MHGTRILRSSINMSCLLERNPRKPGPLPIADIRIVGSGGELRPETGA